MEIKRIFANQEIMTLLEKIQSDKAEKTISKTLLTVLKEHYLMKEEIRSLKGTKSFLEEENAVFRKIMFYESESQKMKEKLRKLMK